MTAAWRRLAEIAWDSREAAVIFTLSRLAIFVMAMIMPIYRVGLANWPSWDGEHYIYLAQHGYTLGSLQGNGIFIAFLPLFPLVVRAFSWLTTADTLHSALTLNYLLGLASAVLFFQYLKRHVDRPVALMAVTLLAFFPWSIFLSAPYTESLFLVLTLASLWLIEEKQFGLAAVVIALATVTRLTGLLLIPLSLWQMWQHRLAVGKSIFYLAVSGAAFAGFVTFQWHGFHTPWAFLEAQQLNWYHRLAWPWVGLNMLWRYSSFTSDTGLMFQTDLLMLIIMIVTLALSWRKVPTLLWWFGLGVVVLTLSSTFILGGSRYMIMVLPSYVFWAEVANRHPVAKSLLPAMFGAGMIFNALLFLMTKQIY